MVSLDALPVIIVESMPEDVRDVRNPQKVNQIAVTSLDELDNKPYELVVFEHPVSHTPHQRRNLTPKAFQAFLDVTYRCVDSLFIYASPVRKGVVA